LDIAKFAQLFKVWPRWPWKVGKIKNLVVCRGLWWDAPTQNLVFLAIRVQEIWPIVCFPRWPPGGHIENAGAKKNAVFSIPHQAVPTA
jgi:hypothetical protein